MTLNSLITRSNHWVYIILAIRVILMHMKLDIQNFIILYPLFILDVIYVLEEMLVRNCPEFCAIHVFGNDNQNMNISLMKNMPPQTTTDATFILTSFRFPGSFSDLNSRQTIGCQRDTSQAIDVIYEIFIAKCKY